MVGTRKKLSVGSIVLVNVLASENNGTTVAPAFVTRVWNDDMVNLKVFMESDEIRWMTSVNVVKSQPDEEDLETGEDENLSDVKVRTRVCWPA